MARINLSIKDELKEKMGKVEKSTNWSKIATDGFIAILDNLEKQQNPLIEVQDSA